MKKYVNLGLIIASSAILFTGCGIKSSEYSASAQNVQTLKKYKNTKIGVSSFSAKNPGQHSTLCRLAETITTPNDESYETYIEKALKEELMMAGLYDEKSKIKINGYLEEVVGSSMLGDAYWKFKIKVSSSNGEEFTVTTKKDYSSSFLAYTACNNMGSTFQPSVKQLITDIINDERFASLLK
ncbi:MAG: hypothetical protein ACNI25_13150 [Halarcobacter sp.]